MSALPDEKPTEKSKAQLRAERREKQASCFCQKMLIQNFITFLTGRRASRERGQQRWRQSTGGEGEAEGETKGKTDGATKTSADDKCFGGTQSESDNGKRSGQIDHHTGGNENRRRKNTDGNFDEYSTANYQLHIFWCFSYFGNF
jgi:hypothetical protein